MSMGRLTRRNARNLQAMKLARRLGIPPEDVVSRWNAGLVWCRHHEWGAKGCCASAEAMREVVAKGLCVACRKRPLATKWHCAECRDRYNAGQRRRYKEKKA